MAESLATKEWLTTRDVMNITGWSQIQVRRRCKDNFFKNIQVINHHYMIHRDEVIAVAQQLGGRNA